jgi:hypothetical protein
MSNNKRLLSAIESSNKAKSLLLAKYNPAWVGNESEIRFSDLSSEDEALYISINKSINEQKSLERRFEKP